MKCGGDETLRSLSHWQVLACHVFLALLSRLACSRRAVSFRLGLVLGRCAALRSPSLQSIRAAHDGSDAQMVSTWSSSSSTGVSRPNMDTTTRTLPRSVSSSSTVPMKEARAPSVIFTLSPTL